MQNVLGGSVDLTPSRILQLDYDSFRGLGSPRVRRGGCRGGVQTTSNPDGLSNHYPGHLTLLGLLREASSPYSFQGATWYVDATSVVIHILEQTEISVNKSNGQIFDKNPLTW